MPDANISFSGYLTPFSALDGEEHPLFHLVIEQLTAVWPGTKRDVIVDILEFDTFIDARTKKVVFEGGSIPKDEVLATFEAVLVRRDDHSYFFEEINTSKEGDFSTEPQGNIPWFRLKFVVDGTDKGNLESNPSPEFIIPVLNPENADTEGAAFELGFSIRERERNLVFGTTSDWPALMRVPRHFVPLAYNTSLMYLDGLHGLINQDFLNADQEDHTATTATGRSDGRLLADMKREQQKAADKALKQLEEQIEKSGSYYGQYLNKLMEYQELMSTYASQLASIDDCDPNDPSRHTMETVAGETRSKLGELKTELDDYVFRFGFIPKGIRKQAEDNIRRQQRVEEIDEFLNLPMIRILALLPYGGTVTGFAKILQGKYLDGMVDLGFSLLQFGAFTKLKSLAYQFNQFDSVRDKPFMAVRALIASKYAKTMALGGPNVGSIRKFAEALDPGFEGLCKAYNSFTALKQCGNEIRNVLKYRSTIQNATRILSGMESGVTMLEFSRALKEARQYSEFLLIVEFLKTANGLRSVPDGVEATMKELERLAHYSHIIPDADKGNESSYELNKLLIVLERVDLSIDKMLQEQQAFPENDVRQRSEQELKYFAPPHAHANNRKVLLSRLDEIVCRIREEVPWRRELAAGQKYDELLSRTYGKYVRINEDQVLERGIMKFCEQLNEMAKYAGCPTWDLTNLIFFQSCVTLNFRGEKYLILTDEGLLEWFREEAMGIIELCSI